MNDRRRLKKLTAVFGEQGDFYRILLHGEEAIKEKKRISKRLYRAVSEKLKESDLSVTDQSLTSYLSYQNKIAGFREEEILSVVPAVSLFILRTLSEIKDPSSPQAQHMLEAAAATLRSLDTGNGEKRYLALSTLEEHLTATDPVYAHCDKPTRDAKKAEIAAFARRHRIDETDAADILKKRPPRTRVKKAIRTLYFLSLWLPALVLTFLPLAFDLSPWLLPFLFLPSVELSKQVSEFFFRRFLPPRHIPKLELSQIPDEGKTAVVITTLLTSEDPTPFHRLERFYLANRDDNLRFGLLLDLADAATPTTRRDKELSDFAAETVDALNRQYGNRFFVAIRSRSHSVSEQKYMGKERKRGALLDFAAFCRDKGDAFSLFEGDSSFLRQTRYLITLDADTDLPIGTVKKMVGAMMHPDNRPILRHGRVVAGYAAMQPRMAVTAPSATGTRFSLLLCGSGGLDVYSSATFDVYESLFGRGIFCGKGIFDLDVYNELLPDAFAEEEILSHDLLEGSLLRCAFLSDVVLTDTFPKTPLSFYTRLHRWYRGDVQALPYAFPTCKKAGGKRHKNPFGLLPRYQLLDNLRRLLTPASAFLALFLSLWMNGYQELLVFPFVTAYIFFPLLPSLCGVRRPSLRRYFSRILNRFWYTFLNVLFNLASLAHMAKISLDALFRSLYRMFVSRRHLLSWTTAAGADARKTGAAAYLSTSLFSMTAGLLFLTFGHSFLPRLLGLAWLCLPLLLVLLAYEYPARPRPLSVKQKALLSRYVFDMWGYFKNHVTAEENFLPPDNLQLTPVRVIAHRTSPTNIGMYLLSCLAVRDFGFIDSHELWERTRATVETLEKMPKKQGHLYNWYDTRTLEILGDPFVSTVDSGNLIVSFVALCQGLTEYTGEEPRLQQVIFRVKRLMEDADFSLLYCKERDLFYIARGNDEPSSQSCYDIFMSEARTTGYYAVAAGLVPKRHWEKLSRILVGRGRYTGLASWSGTAFEYYMPHLFLPIVKNSMSYEALSFCSALQMGRKFNGLWGISESAYYAFDADMNYQYKAHGIDAVALDAAAGKDRVIAPYAAFLQLARFPSAAMANLAALSEFGAYGDYGFYEAVDFTPASVGKGCAVIQSFMSHHLGMSILAAANAVMDNIFVRRFMGDPRMASAAELLDERIPAEAPLFRGKWVSARPERPARLSHPAVEKEVQHTPGEDRMPTFALISNGRAACKVSSRGGAELYVKNTWISAPAFARPGEPPMLSSLAVVCRMGEKNFFLRPGSFSYSGTRAVFSCRQEGCDLHLHFGVHGEKNLFCLTFTAEREKEEILPTLVFQPLLQPRRDWLSAPFYADLSMEASFSREEDLLLLRLRGREDRPEAWLGVHAKTILTFGTRKDLLPCPYTEEDILALASAPLGEQTGAVISPLVAVRAKPFRQNGKSTVDFLIAYGATRNEVREALAVVGDPAKNSRRGLRDAHLPLREKPVSDLVSESLRPVVRGMLTALGNDRPEARFAELYLSVLTHPMGSAAELSGSGEIAGLWSLGISGDDPLLVLRPGEDTPEKNEKIARLFLKLHRLFREKGVRSELVFLCKETDNYHKPLTRQMGKLVAEEAGNGYIGRHGGIFLVNDPGKFSLVASVACLYLPIDKNTSPEELYYSVTRRKALPAPAVIEKNAYAQTPEPPAGALRLPGGWFAQDGFTVVKKEASGVRSFAYASSLFGTLVTANSPGYTWFGNSKEGRLTEPSSDLRRDITRERVLVQTPNALYDPCALSDTVTFGEDGAHYHAIIEGKKVTVHIGIDARLPVKLILTEAPDSWRVSYDVQPSCSSIAKFRHMIRETKEGSTLFWRHPLSSSLAEKRLFLSALPPQGEKRAFLFGVLPQAGDRLYRFLREKYRDPDALAAGMTEYADRLRELFSPTRFTFSDKGLTFLANRFLPYQTYVVRMLARSGYQQSGGAYGFRDQLQDAMALLPYAPILLKQQILRACAHQYEEGDVQHWWHPRPQKKGCDPGLRTRISDDLLWLPYAVARYVRVTGDRGLLTLPVSYLSSPPLAPGENDRYETPGRSPDKEGVYHHCMRAIEASLRLSPEGLPLMGSGDWNDSFNRVGLFGKGISIFLARFMQLVFRDFIPVTVCMKDKGSEAFLRDKEAILDKAVETHAWEGDRYLRARYDSGVPMGSASSAVCAIDLLPQAFSAIVKGANDRTVQAMQTACRLLYDEENKILRLFTPPFPAERQEAGYVSAYCDGLRENGGQYTHGALFGIAGLFALGETRRATSYLLGIAPTFRLADPALAEKYNAEPYFLCGDIYDNPEHRGRAGWGLYTGAAGWYLRVLTEYLAGLREEAEGFTMTPALSDLCPRLTLKLTRGPSIYHISAYLSDRDRVILDQKELYEKKSLFPFTPGSHILEIAVKRS